MYLPWEKPTPPVPPPVVVAEIGCNHMGRPEIAREMVRVAAGCGARVVKFQKRCPRECLTPAEYAAPHPEPTHAFGTTYGEHREALEFPIQVHAELKSFAESLGVRYAASVWDPTSAREVIALGPDYVKVPSARNTDTELLGIVRDEYGGEVHVSTGMAAPADVDRLVDFFAAAGAAERLVLYACTSAYPAPFHEVCLLEIRRLRERYGARIGGVGFSGHHLGIAVDVAAFALGARWIERHFTLDRTWKGTDHAASLEPPGLAKLCRDLEAVALAWRDKPAQGLLPSEEAAARKLKRRRRWAAPSR